MGVFAHKLSISGEAYDNLTYRQFLTYKQYIDRLMDEDKKAAARLS